MLEFIIFIFVAAILVVWSGGSQERLERRLEDIKHYHQLPRKTEDKVFIDKKGIRVAKEGRDLTFDISTSKSHRRFFIPDITKTDVEDLIEGLTKLHTMM